MCLDLGELELSVVGVHLADLLSGRGPEDLDGERREGEGAAEDRKCLLAWIAAAWWVVNRLVDAACPHLDDFHQLIHSTVAGKDRLS